MKEREALERILRESNLWKVHKIAVDALGINTVDVPTVMYEVSVVNTFDAVTPEDAVLQMAGWLDDASYDAGYRVVDANTGDNVGFFDADDLCQTATSHCPRCDVELDAGRCIEQTCPYYGMRVWH